MTQTLVETAAVWNLTCWSQGLPNREEILPVLIDLPCPLFPR
jgi:hypothetical protein